MNAKEEQDMHDLAVRLEQLTRGTGWEAMRYEAIGRVMEQLVEYCAVKPKKMASSRCKGHASWCRGCLHGVLDEALCDCCGDV